MQRLFPFAAGLGLPIDESGLAPEFIANVHPDLFLTPCGLTKKHPSGIIVDGHNVFITQEYITLE
jgi:hypothetical protein